MHTFNNSMSSGAPSHTRSLNEDLCQHKQMRTIKLSAGPSPGSSAAAQSDQDNTVGSSSDAEDRGDSDTRTWSSWHGIGTVECQTPSAR